MADFYSCIFLVISHYMATRDFIEGKDVTSSLWYSVLAISIVYAAVRELLQIYMEHVRWFLSPWNYVDLFAIGLVIASLVQMSINVQPTTNFVVVTTACLWFNVITFLRSTVMSFGTFVGGIFKIITDLFPFIAISSLILIAFGEMFSMTLLIDQIDRGEECKSSNFTDFCSFKESFIITYGLFVEGIDFGQFYANKNNIMLRISIAFSFLVAIILLNVVIAIVSESWNEAVKHGKEVVSQVKLSNYFVQL